MGIFDKLFKPATVQNQPTSLRRTWSEAPKPETQRLPTLYHQSPKLDPVDLIASTIANSPIELFDKTQYRKDKDNAKPAEDHPFYELIENPSRMFPEIDGHTLLNVTVVLTELLGEMFWVKIREGSKVVELLPFPPAWCITTPTSGNPQFLFQPFGTTAGKTMSVSPEDVVWFKQPNIVDPYGRGRGRTEAVGDELDTDEMAKKWQKNYFYNDATPPFWANLPGVQTSDLQRMRDSWGQRLGGWLNARKPAFTNSENLQIIKLGDTTREMDFVESSKYLRDVFLQHYAIPPELFGIVENSNRSTIDSAYYLFAKNVIARRLGFYERVITRQLIHPDFDNRLIAKFKFDIPEDEAFKLTKANAGLAAGALTRGEWKKIMGMAVTPADDVYLVPMSLMFVPAASTPQAEKPATPEPKEPVINLVDEAEKKITINTTKGLTVTQKEMHWKAADNRATQGEGMFRSRVRAFSEVQKSRVLKELNPKTPIDESLKKAFDGADEALKHALAPAWLASMTDGAEIGRGFLGLKASPSWTLYNVAFDIWIKTKGLLLAKEINQTTFDALRESLNLTMSEGIAAGESIAKIAGRLMDATNGVYDNMSASRAELIARTETMRSVNTGQSVVYKEEGVKEKEWLANLDDRVRDSHAAMNGKIVGVDEMFDVPANTDPLTGKILAEGEEMEAPATGSVAGQNCMCRCTIAPVIKL